jgi:hypothetical protein
MYSRWQPAVEIDGIGVLRNGVADETTD